MSRQEAHESPRWKAPIAIVAAVGPIAFIALVTVLGAMWDGYDPIRDTQSELGAVDSPYGSLMNVAGFMGIGVSILCFASAYHVTLRPSAARVVATALLAISGAGMVAVGFFPCDPGCVDVTSTSRMHSILSAPGAIGLPLASMLSTSVFRNDGRLGCGWQIVSFWLGLAVLAVGPLVATETLAGIDGLLQRAGMWTSLLWMTAVSVKLCALGTVAAAPNGVAGGSQRS